MASRREPPVVLVVAALHLAVLWTFAVAQPLFDLLGGNAEFFVARDSRAIDIVIFGVALVAVPPLAMLALEAGAFFVHRRVRQALHLVLVGGLAAILALQVLGDAGDGSSEVLLPLSALVGMAAALVYQRAQVVRSFLTVLSPAPLVFLLLFLLVSPVSKLVIGGGETSLAHVSTDAPVVMVVLDELPLSSLLGPDGKIDAERYPNFAALARGSTWFRRTSTVEPNTEQAVPAVLTGLWPSDDRLPIAADNHHSVFTLLGRSHRVHATEPVTRLCPAELCHRASGGGLGSRLRSLASDVSVVSMHQLLPSDLRRRLPSISGTWRDFRGGPNIPTRSRSVDRKREGAEVRRRTVTARDEADRAGIEARFVASIRPPRTGGRPAFYFLHVLLPHHPWEYLPSGRRYAPGSVGLVDSSWASADEADRGYQRHLLQVGFADRMLGNLLRRLRATDMYDRSLVVVTADHGASFRAGQPLRGISRTTESDIAFVPLFIKAPRQQRGRVLDRPLQTVDILPTMADALGIEMPWRVDGHSGLEPGAGRGAFFIYNPLFITREQYPVRRLEAGLSASVKRKEALFGAGDAEPGLYGLGPRADLLGQPSAALGARRSTELEASVDDSQLFTEVSPQSGFLPARITGTLHGSGADEPLDLAIALNGRIVATTRSTRSEGSAQFDAELPETAFMRGSNQVEIVALPNGAGAPLLLARTSKRAALHAHAWSDTDLGRKTIADRRAGDEGLRGPDRAATGQGRDHRLGSGGRPAGGPGRRLQRGPLRRLGIPRVDRPDVARDRGSPSRRPGFRLQVTIPALDRSRAGVSVFAVANGRAKRLPPTTAACAARPRAAAGCR